MGTVAHMRSIPPETPLANVDLSAAPVAACIVNRDRYFTLLWANGAFFELMDCTEQEMGFRYANHISALWDQEAVGHIAELAHNDPPSRVQTFRHHIATKKGVCELLTKAAVVPFENTEAICCITSDYTSETGNELEIEQLHRLCAHASAAAQLGLFTYNEKDRSTHFAAGCEALGKIALPDSICADFPTTVVREKLVHPEDEAVFLETFSDEVGKGAGRSCDVRLGGPNSNAGRWRWYHLSLLDRANASPSNEGQQSGVLVDITEYKELTITYLNETQFYYAMLAESTGYAHVDVTDDTLTKVGGMWALYNELIEKITFTELFAAFVGKVVHPEDRDHYKAVMNCENFITSINNGIDQLKCEFRRIGEQNKMVWMELTVHLLKDPLTHHVLGLLRIKNIDKKKRQELMLQSSSERDPLTRILHKKASEVAVRERLRHGTANEVGAFMILDIDDFKDINDRFGHEAGDRALVSFTNAVGRIIDRNDIFGRFGGDEFTLFVDDAGDKAHVEKLIGAIAEQLRQECDPPITCSIGVAMPLCSDSYDVVFRQADAALYAVKNAGKDSYRFYSDMAVDEEAQVPLRATEKHLNPEKGHTFASAEDVLPPYVPSNHRAIDAATRFPYDKEPPSFSEFLSEQGEIAYLVDPDTFALICGNKAFYERIGETPSSCLGMKCYEAMQRRKSPCPFCSKANWATDKFFMWRNANEALEQEFLIKNKLVTWQDREALLAIAIDISNDKSIVDSLDNGTSEGSFLLSGIHGMNTADTLGEAIERALETVGGFFRAANVRFWTPESGNGLYRCAATWTRHGRSTRPATHDDGAISAWLAVQKWDKPLFVESPETVLQSSFSMYQYMKDNRVDNARWVEIRDTLSNEQPDYISVENMDMNLQNVAFLEQFSVFIASEVRKRRLMDTLLHAWSYDDLTGMLNRNSYESRISSFDSDKASNVGIVSANINNMKQINNAKGFATGNYYLMQFASMLSMLFPADSIYRLNGDEFAVIVENIDRIKLERSIRDIREAADANGQFSIAIGYSWDDVEKNIGVLTDQAVAAMEADKRRFHDTAQDVNSDEDRRASLHTIVSSLHNGDFLMFLQPKVDLKSGRTIGAEALVRYRDERQRIVAPARFIPTLEDNGLIRHVDLFVFEQVCRLLERWNHAGTMLPVSLNFSRRTVLESDIMKSVEDIAARYDFDRSLLEIEITESFGTIGKGILYQTASDFLSAGFSLSLDDFGTKYTDFSILSSIDFNMVKLDKSLIDSLVVDKSEQIVVKHIIGMCNELGIDIIAEGIETAEQEAMLKNLGCRLGQGYLYSRPIPLDEFERNFAKPL